MNRIIFVFAILLLAGCGITPLRKIDTKNTFDADQAKALLADGINTIKGSALIRQSGGGVVSCAGNKVWLIPATAYATERTEAIFGSAEQGYNPVYGGRRVVFNNEPPEYQKLKRETLCDVQGYFKFDKVTNGEFYVSTTIVWRVNNYVNAGGLLTKRVSLTNGETKEITLTP